MNDRIVSRDQGTGLMLVRGDQDPPRFYLRLNGRRELISIGDQRLALRQFSRELQRLRTRRRPAEHMGVMQFPQRPPDMTRTGPLLDHAGHAA